MTTITQTEGESVQEVVFKEAAVLKVVSGMPAGTKEHGCFDTRSIPTSTLSNRSWEDVYTKRVSDTR